MNGLTLNYLNSVDKANLQRLNSLAENPYDSSVAAAYEFQAEIMEQNFSLAKVVEAAMAAQENREAVGHIIDRLV